jgi:hypothetical protein
MRSLGCTSRLPCCQFLGLRLRHRHTRFWERTGGPGACVALLQGDGRSSDLSIALAGALQAALNTVAAPHRSVLQRRSHGVIVSVPLGAPSAIPPLQLASAEQLP